MNLRHPPVQRAQPGAICRLLTKRQATELVESPAPYAYVRPPRQFTDPFRCKRGATTVPQMPFSSMDLESVDGSWCADEAESLTFLSVRASSAGSLYMTQRRDRLPDSAKE
jgi:hypothetical protein